MKAMTPGNMHAAFKATGIFPFNKDIFSDLEFAPSEIIYREIEHAIEEGDVPDNVINRKRTTSHNIAHFLSINDEIRTETPAMVAGTPANGKYFVSPFEFRGLPIAGPRKGGRARRKGRSMIAIDTPDKEELELKEAQERKEMKESAKAKKRKVLQDFTSEDDEDEFSVYSEQESWFENESEMMNCNNFTAPKICQRKIPLL